MFPTTRLDSALSNTKSKNPNNIQFYKWPLLFNSDVHETLFSHFCVSEPAGRIGTWMIKVFYVWAKHFMGFHINYLRFLGAITPREMKVIISSKSSYLAPIQFKKCCVLVPIVRSWSLVVKRRYSLHFRVLAHHAL